MKGKEVKRWRAEEKWQGEPPRLLFLLVGAQPPWGPAGLQVGAAGTGSAALHPPDLRKWTHVAGAY